MKIVVGADHAGYRKKNDIVKYLRSLGHAVRDAGTLSEDSVDYPDFACDVAQAVHRGEARRGLLVCGTGLGMAMAANKVPGIRAAAVWSAETARLAAEHNDANVLCLSGRLFKTPELHRMVKTWLGTRFAGGRHARRLRKIAALDKRA